MEQRIRGLYKPRALRVLMGAIKAQELAARRPGRERKGNQIDFTAAGVRLNCDEKFGIGLEH